MHDRAVPGKAPHGHVPTTLMASFSISFLCCALPYPIVPCRVSFACPTIWRIIITLQLAYPTEVLSFAWLSQGAVPCTTLPCRVMPSFAWPTTYWISYHTLFKCFLMLCCPGVQSPTLPCHAEQCHVLHVSQPEGLVSIPDEVPSCAMLFCPTLLCLAMQSFALSHNLTAYPAKVFPCAVPGHMVPWYR